MSVEQGLREVLKSGGKLDDHFRKQLSDFRNFERRLKQGGLEIERKEFSIPLMDRLDVSYLHQR